MSKSNNNAIVTKLTPEQLRLASLLHEAGRRDRNKGKPADEKEKSPFQLKGDELRAELDAA